MKPARRGRYKYIPESIRTGVGKLKNTFFMCKDYKCNSTCKDFLQTVVASGNIVVVRTYSLQEVGASPVHKAVKHMFANGATETYRNIEAT